MVLYDYLISTYEENVPILLAELEVNGMSDVNLRRQLKKLTDAGKIKRYDTGIYFIPKESVFKSGSMISLASVLEKKYLQEDGRQCGYVSGYMFVNSMGLTTQVPTVYDIVTNKATSEYRETAIAGNRIILRKPKVEVTEENVKILQFLDLLKDVDVYSEITGDGLRKRILQYMKEMEFTFSMLEPYLTYYPDKLYKNMYETGVLAGVSA